MLNAVTSTQNKEYVLYIVAKIISLRQFSVSRTILRKEKIYTLYELSIVALIDKKIY